MTTRRKKLSLVLAGLLIVTLLATVVGCQQATPAEDPAEEPTEAPADEPTDEPEEEASGELQLAGSSTVQPVAQALAEAYMEDHPNVQIDVQGGGSSVGVKSAAEGTVPIGNASRALKDSEMEEYPDLIAHTIARDGIAIAVHPEVPIDGLELEEVQSIFAGELTNWSEVGGPDETIVVVSREEGSGTRGAFEDMVMGDAVIVDTALLQPSNGAVKTTVASTPLSIGFLSFGYLDDSVKALAIDGVEATVENALNESYPVVRPLNMVTKGEPTGLAADFLDFIMSEEGQAIVAEDYIPVSGGGAGEEAGLSGELQLAGSSTVQPLAQALAEAFMEEYPDVQIDVQGGGSSVGVKSAAEGTTPIGNASRALKESEKEEYPDLIAHTIARDGIAIAVHPDVPVDGLELAEVQAIFAGEVTSWSEVGGPDENIIVVSREEGSGTRGAFEDMVMGDEVIADTALLQPSNGAVKTTVSSTPLSIGFLSFGYLDDSVKALAIDGVEATVANAMNESYPVVRPLNMVTKGEPTGLAKEYLDFIMSEEGQAIVAEDYIPVSGGGEAEAETEMALSGELQMAGSSTVQPLAQALAEAFMEKHPDVQIDVQGGGSSVGVKSAAEGTTPIGNASRALKDSEKEEYPDLIAHAIAQDGIAIAAHRDVPVEGVTKDQVRQVFAGEITNWSELGGPDENIIVVSREEGSGTRGAFEDMVMGDELIVDTALLQPSNGAVKTTVASTPWSMGFLSFGYLDGSVKALAVDGVEATVANASSGEYPVVRPLNMVTRGEPTGLAKAFLDFAFSDEGQAIVAEDYIPVSGGEEAEMDLSGELQMAGSSTVQPLAQALAEAFMEKYPDVQIDVQGGGSSVGVKSAAEGTTPIGNASRALKDSEMEEYPDLIAHTIARDGIAIAVHPDVPVDGVSKDEVRQVFAGEITNWSELGGPDENIIVVSREEGSGTRGAFEDMVMDESLIVDTALLQPSNGAVKTTVASTPFSMGFLSFGYLDDSVKALAVDGVDATVENAMSDDYPVVRPLNMVTKGEPTGLAKAYLDFIMSDAGQEIVAEDYIPVK